MWESLRIEIPGELGEVLFAGPTLAPHGAYRG